MVVCFLATCPVVNSFEIGRASCRRMKKAPNDTDLLLHPSENEDPKELPDLLAYKSCTAYMGNLKIMFMDNFREKKTTVGISQGKLE